MNERALQRVHQLFDEGPGARAARSAHAPRSPGCGGVRRGVFCSTRTAPAHNIVSAVKACDLYVLVWSRHSQASHWVHEVLGMARAFAKPIMPLVLEDGLALPDLIRD